MPGCALDLLVALSVGLGGRRLGPYNRDLAEAQVLSPGDHDKDVSASAILAAHRLALALPHTIALSEGLATATPRVPTPCAVVPNAHLEPIKPCPTAVASVPYGHGAHLDLFGEVHSPPRVVIVPRVRAGLLAPPCVSVTVNRSFRTTANRRGRLCRTDVPTAPLGEVNAAESSRCKPSRMVWYGRPGPSGGDANTSRRTE